MSWQDMSTAPKDGESVLLYSKNFPQPHIIQAHFFADPDGGLMHDDGDWYVTWDDSAGPIDEVPTHWQPLPDEPEDA